jgi:hypothetical protein
VGDTSFEESESFRVSLSSPVNASINNSLGTGTIQNDDVRININGVSMNEGDSGTTNFDFTISLTGSYSLQIDVDFATSDNTAIAPGDYAPVSGSVTFLPGETAHMISVPVVGDLFLEAVESFRVNLFNPVNASIHASVGTGSILNDDTNPAVSIGDMSMTEGNTGTTQFNFEVTLTNPSLSDIIVFYQTIDGTAMGGSDFTTASGFITIPALDPGGTISIDVLGDTDVEPDEGFQVEITSASGAFLGDAFGDGTIENDDLPGAISINDVSMNEGNTGNTSFDFSVTLGAPSLGTITVDLATADGTAIDGLDYTGGAGSLTFLPAETLMMFSVQVLGDPTDECDESFFVNLSNPVNGVIVDGQGLGTIVSDDLLGCTNADGDCFHDPACGGLDCDDSDANTYPGAPEVNETLDNQCPGEYGFGVVDEVSGVTGLLNPDDDTEYSWPAQTFATLYEVARSTDPSFASNCTLFPATANTFVLDTVAMSPGDLAFFNVRPTSPNLGSWGQDSDLVERIFTCPNP